jgi:hypothetical protein
MLAPILVPGAGGFIGRQLVADLLKKGNVVRAVDQKPLTDWWQKHDAAENRSLDYSLSTCVYAADKQTDPNVTALKEEDGYPDMPEVGYGWEKLFSKRMHRHFTEKFKSKPASPVPTTSTGRREPGRPVAKNPRLPSAKRSRKRNAAGTTQSYSGATVSKRRVSSSSMIAYWPRRILGRTTFASRSTPAQANSSRSIGSPKRSLA